MMNALQSSGMLAAMAPQAMLAVSLGGTLLSGILLKDKAAALARAIAFAGILAAGAALLAGPLGPSVEAMSRVDGAAKAWEALFLLAALAFLAVGRLPGDRSIALFLGSLIGMCLIAVADNLILLFIALETMSLPTYLLVHGLRPGRRSLEAAVKYFFAGAAASALFLLGLAVRYAATGSFSIETADASVGSFLGLVLMGSAALFKVGPFPFMFWLPDVYEAAEPEFSGFMWTAVKAAGFLLLLRLLEGHSAAAAALTDWLPALAAATMTFGNLLALRQKSLQRLLAYSSIAHVGYLLAATWAWGAQGGSVERLDTLWFYLAGYLFMNTGAFLFLLCTGVRDADALRGFGRRAPWLSGFFILMLLSLGGIPPTMGFLAKFFVIWELIKAGGIWLAAVFALNSLAALGYYLRLVRLIAFEDTVEGTAQAPAPAGAGALAVMAVCAAATLLLGLAPAVRDILFASFFAG